MSELYGASETSVVKVIAGSEAIVFNNQVCYLQTVSYSHHPRPINYEQDIKFRVLQESYPNL